MRLAPRLISALFASIFLFLSHTPSASAQIGIYGELSASDFNLSNTSWHYGTTFGLYYDRWSIPFLAFGLDGRGSVVGSGSTKVTSGLAGPRLTFKPHVMPVMPYVEALAGAGDATYTQGGVQISATKLEYQYLGGADFTIFPRVDWRVLEFSYGGFSGPNLNPRTLSTGLVLRLP